MCIYFSVTRVGFETTSYNISESDEVVQICINAAGSNTLCSNTDHFQLTLNTADQSAGKMLCVLKCHTLILETYFRTAAHFWVCFSKAFCALQSHLKFLQLFSGGGGSLYLLFGATG